MSEVDVNAPEVQEAIRAAVEESVSALKANNTKLIEELRIARKGKAIDPAEVEKLEGQIEALKAENGKLTKDAKVAAKAAEEASKKAEAAEGGMTKLLVENGLNEALAKAGVTNPVHQKAAKAMLAAQVQIADDNGARVPKVGEKALAEFITEWAGSDEGKHFVTAPDMAGGGAHNNSGAAPPAGNKSSMSPQAKADFIGKHGAEAYSNLSD